MSTVLSLALQVRGSAVHLLTDPGQTTRFVEVGASARLNADQRNCLNRGFCVIVSFY